MEGKEVLSGGLLCRSCGYQYPVANPVSRLRSAHRKNCRKMLVSSKATVAAEETGASAHKRRRGVDNASADVGREEEPRRGREALPNNRTQRRERKLQPKLMANDPMSSREKSMIRNDHYNLYPTRDAPQCNIFSFGPLFRLSKDAMIVTKGIKVTAGKTIDYKPEKGRIMFVFEAGVIDELHASGIRGSIGIYLTHKNETVCVGSISKAQSRARLWLMLSGESKLFHDAERKTIFFNCYEYSHIYRRVRPLKTDKKLWVAKVKPYEDAAFNPVEDESKYCLLKVFSDANNKEEIDIHVRSNKEVKRLGALSSGDISLSCKLEFDDQFSLSHTSEAVDVVFYGYTVRHIQDEFWAGTKLSFVVAVLCPLESIKSIANCTNDGSVWCKDLVFCQDGRRSQQDLVM